MEPGETFKIDNPAVPNWLWVVICRDDVADSELIAGIVSARHKSFDPACEVAASEHDSLFESSFVNYAMARVLTPSLRAKISDFLENHGRISDELLLRIQRGCVISNYAYPPHKELVLRVVSGVT